MIGGKKEGWNGRMGGGKGGGGGGGGGWRREWWGEVNRGVRQKEEVEA